MIALRVATIALLVGAGCAAPRPSPAQAYDQGRKAGVVAYIPPPGTANERRRPADYYRSMKADVRVSADRYYVGSAWHWESRNFRQGFVDGLIENLEARAQKADAEARGTAEDYAQGKKMALDLGASSPDVDFKAMPARYSKETGGIRIHLTLNAEEYYRTAYVDARRAKEWALQPEQFRAGFVDGFLELCGAEKAEKEEERARRSPAEDYLRGLQAGKRAAGLLDPDDRTTMETGTEEQRAPILEKASQAAGLPAESPHYREGFVDGFREACGQK